MKLEVKLYALVLLLILSVIALSQPRRIDNNSNKELEGPTITLRATKTQNSGELRPITSEFFAPEEPLIITPTDPTTLETRQSPTILSVAVPKDDKRTYLFLSLGGVHSWHQFPSSAPYQLTGSFNQKYTSTALPAPGFFSLDSILDGQMDDQPSVQGTTRFRDGAVSFGLENTILDAVFKVAFPAVSQEQRAQLIEEFLRSEITVELRVRVRLRSVDEFRIADAYLQVYGDGSSNSD